MSSTQDYSGTWFETFLFTVPDESTAQELAFLERQLPLPAFRRILDVCCGAGRHARALMSHGYEVTGVDRSPIALAEARRHGLPQGSQYLELDMREIGVLDSEFDGAVCLWQSFGYFDDATNRHVLELMRERLRPHGRVVLDIYDRRFFECHQGESERSRAGVRIHERRRMNGNRYQVRLTYVARDDVDEFEWRVYSPDEVRALAQDCGLKPLLSCVRFDETQAPSADVPRMQWVLERSD